jgi:dephospho-CoA kinase
MLVVGLVGGIGSGKTTAAGILGELGAEVVHADLVGHEVYRPGTDGFAQVVAAFGREVIGVDGTIDRKQLGSIVFRDPSALERLNAIVHPLIKREIAKRIADARQRGGVPAFVVEAAILLEAGWRSLVDEVWLVSAGRDQVVDRLRAERGLAADEVDARRARQMNEAERRKAADVVVDNQGTLDALRARLGELWQQRVVH